MTKPKVTISLTTEGDAFPTALEMSVTKEQILTHLEKLDVCRYVSFKEKPLLIPDQNGLKRISEKDILYIEAERSYCTFHFIAGKKLMVASPMNAFEEYFSAKGFVRIHKCHVVNLDCVDFIQGNTLILTGGQIKLNIGDNYKKRFISHFTVKGSKSRKYN